MTRLSALLLAAGALAVVIALEISGAPRTTVAPSHANARPAAAAAARPIANHTDAWVATVLARPLFSPDRRPAAVAAAVDGSSLPGLPRLTGIMVGPFGRSAIFAESGAKPIVVQEGGRIASYTVKSIDTMQVRLLGPDGVKVLNPIFDTASAPASRVGRASTHR